MHTTPRLVRRAILVACTVTLGLTPLHAQGITAPTTPAPDASLFAPAAGFAPVGIRPRFSSPIFESSPEQGDSRNQSPDRSGRSQGMFASLYAGLITTQVLDVHSTLRALDAGHREANPVVRWATKHPAALISFKAGTTVGMSYLIQGMRKKHPKRALVLLAAVDTAFALVVAHNYSVPIGR